MESYDTILQRMTERYEELQGMTISNESDMMLRLRTLAGEIFKQQVNMDFLKRQMFPSTATGEYLDKHAAERGLVRKEAQKASGYVYFFPEDGVTEDVVIPKGTVVCTYTTLKRFETDVEAVLKQGEERVMVHVTAAEAGAGSNTNGGTITVLVTPIAGIKRVYAGATISNGVDEESDESLRERIFDSFQNISNGTNAAYYKSAAMSVSGVCSAGVVPRARGNGTVDVYVAGNGAAVDSETLQKVQSVLDEARELNVDVKAKNASKVYANFYVQITPKTGYAFDEVKEAVTKAAEEYVESLGVGNDLLVSKLGDVIFHTEGVEDYRFHELYGSDITVSQSQYASLDTLTVKEA